MPTVPETCEVGAGGYQVQELPEVQNEFMSRLVSLVRPYLNENTKKSEDVAQR